MCLLKFNVNSNLHFSYSDPEYPTSDITAVGLPRVYCKWQNNGLVGLSSGFKIKRVDQTPHLLVINGKL
jgi:hypothetical protein